MMSWMLVAILIGALLTVAARAAESAGRDLGYSVRWVWAGALALLISLSIWALYRSHLIAASAPPSVTPVQGSQAVIVYAAAALHRAAPNNMGNWLLVAWFVASATLLGLLGLVLRRMHRERRTWPLLTLHGVPVRVAPTLGPMVLGLVRPEIVVPRWLLERPDHEQQLMLAHEAQHIAARDNLLLGSVCIVAALMPWNPAVWIMLSRFRLTMELDCDARVLRAGATRHMYGALLIDVAAHRADPRFIVPALVGGASHLYKRIIAMNAQRPKFTATRASLAAVIGFAALVAACDANVPTASDVQKLDASTAEQAAEHFQLATAGNVTYTLNGNPVSTTEAKGVPASSINRIEVVKSNGSSVINLVTNGTVTADAPQEVVHPTPTGTPLVFINGKLASFAKFKAMNPITFASMEVVKGRAAVKFYNQKGAENGVILVTTKDGASTK